ncbi:hypothetical protein Sjap_000883 [Stephania japonica]|uniref:Uncharacterized protein n=1 Tax=Stephania japonica TaxID=461633 RepID=A0AAP0KIZ3_9MAGN
MLQHDMSESMSLEVEQHSTVEETLPYTITNDESSDHGQSLVVENDENHAIDIAIAMAASAEAAAAAAHAALMQLRAGNRRRINSRGERAATLIQSHYRGYLARSELRAMRGLVRLQALVRGHILRKQLKIDMHMTMKSMQAVVRVQTRAIRERRQLFANKEQRNEGTKIGNVTMTPTSGSLDSMPTSNNIMSRPSVRKSRSLENLSTTSMMRRQPNEDEGNGGGQEAYLELAAMLRTFGKTTEVIMESQSRMAEMIAEALVSQQRMLKRGLKRPGTF